MPQPNKIPLAFAASGDKNVIPESTETTGLASWRDGFPAITSAPFSEGGIAPKRADFNGIFNALSQAVMWLQQGGVYVYDTGTDYEAGNVVLDAGGLYVANAANGPSSAVVQPSSDMTGATWKLVRLDLATQSAAGYMSAEDKTALDNVPSTYLPLSGGSISGSIIQTDSSNATLKFSNTTGRLMIAGGTAYNTGAIIWLFGKDHATTPGIFQFDANDGNQYSRLLGKPDGTLTWGAKEVERVRASGSDYICYESGIQICWGYVSTITVNQEKTISFGRAFADTNTVVLISRRSGASSTTVADEAWVRGTPTTTSFGLYATTPTGYTWIAIGKGAA